MLSHRGVSYSSYLSHLLILFLDSSEMFFLILYCFFVFLKTLIITSPVLITTSILIALEKNPQSSRKREIRSGHVGQLISSMVTCGAVCVKTFQKAILQETLHVPGSIGLSSHYFQITEKVFWCFCTEEICTVIRIMQYYIFRTIAEKWITFRLHFIVLNIF